MNSRPRISATLISTMQALLLMLTATGVLGAEPELDAVVSAVSQDMIAAFRQERDTRVGNPARLAELGEKKILPHVDTEHMTRLAMDAIWPLATLAQRRRLAQEFSTLLVRAFSAALASYSDQLVVVSRVRAETRDKDVAVRFEINQPDAQPMAIDYSLARTPSGWRVYDIRIGGASLVTAFRPAFSEEVRNHGIESLIDLLSGVNRQINRQIAPVRL